MKYEPTEAEKEAAARLQDTKEPIVIDEVIAVLRNRLPGIYFADPAHSMLAVFCLLQVTAAIVAQTVSLEGEPEFDRLKKKFDRLKKKCVDILEKKLTQAREDYRLSETPPEGST